MAFASISIGKKVYFSEVKPKVTVCVVTYNQEKYIRQCLQSVVDQVTSFDFEVIVGDDCSTDGTRAVVQEFARLYPSVVRPIYHEKNIGGGYYNYLTVHRAARGEYVSHLDGDDVMLPFKLQLQADAMDADVDCSASFHLMEVINDESIRSGKLWLSDNYDSCLSLKDLLFGHPNVGHSSLMYRRVLLRDFIFSRDSSFIDLHVYVALAGVGPLISINEVLGLYRVGVGVSASEAVLDLVFNVLDNVDCLVLQKDVVDSAALRFASNFAMSMLLNGNCQLFLKYSSMKCKYGYRNGFFDHFMSVIAANKASFFVLSKLYLCFSIFKSKLYCYFNSSK